MKIRINKNLFELFPNFCRGVVIANGINNLEEDIALSKNLKYLEKKMRFDSSLRDYKNHPQIFSWRKAFEKFCVNPNSKPPSIANLAKRTFNGSSIPFISNLVSIFNIVSLQNIVPCGGDDLNSIVGDLVLGIANGIEEYTPLGKPEIKESIPRGEVIYFDTGDKKVLCRAWCWRNSHITRIKPETTKVAINVDGLPPVTPEAISKITQSLATKVKKHCGGTVRAHLLSISNPEIEIVI